MKKRLQSFKYAFKGIVDVLKSEPNAWIHAFIGACVLAAGFYFELSELEWCVIVICITSVLATEAMNTAVEHLTDLVSPEHHPLAGRAKDAAAGAVLLVAIGAAIVGLIIFLPKLMVLF